MSVRVDPTIRVIGDGNYLVRLFANLLDNALQHTPDEGSVEVQSPFSGDRIAVAIRDPGCGIARDHLSHLGDRFYRVNESRSRRNGGTGLGLAISKTIVEAHAGQMEIMSEVGKGTTVILTLPLADSSTVLANK